MEKYYEALKIPFDAKIGVLCGGMSSEREVSLRSGKNCFKALQSLGYKNTELIDVDKNISKILLDKNIEIAYIALHGKYGEDGCIQGLLEVLGIPYTGSGVKASAIAMDKEYTKIMLKSQNIPVIPSVVIYNISNLEQKKLNLNYPLMIKPLCEGSSIGMSKVNSENELKKAVEIAQNFDSGVMIEEYINGKSMTVGVLDIDNKTIATPILEFRTKTEWYDYEAKYTHGMTEFILPSKISDELTKKIQDFAVKTHNAVGAKGMSRVDFILSQDNTIYVLEINTIPGMTDLSDLPAQAKSMGIDYNSLVGIILNSVLM
ncbi:MAG: D-alanine--D-alanine ligase [bacterium]